MTCSQAEHRYNTETCQAALCLLSLAGVVCTETGRKHNLWVLRRKDSYTCAKYTAGNYWVQ